MKRVGYAFVFFVWGMGGMDHTDELQNLPDMSQDVRHIIELLRQMHQDVDAIAQNSQDIGAVVQELIADAQPEEHNNNALPEQECPKDENGRCEWARILEQNEAALIQICTGYSQKVREHAEQSREWQEEKEALLQDREATVQELREHMGEQCALLHALQEKDRVIADLMQRVEAKMQHEEAVESAVSILSYLLFAYLIKLYVG